ncbi:MAG: hypothetical protein EOM40_16270 [Clostridia bacterium]|nr:hypothetical protein [Clostridia bacterium]NCC43971.1 hypothetical protein [Clostridia bacterium]
MSDTDYTKVSAIYKKIKEAENDHRVIYISGAVGFGKTTAVKYYFRRKAYLYLSGRDGYLESRPKTETIRQNVIVIDDISWITDGESQDYIRNIAASEEKQVVLIGRSTVPPWLRITSIEKNFVLADERDLVMDEAEIRKFLDDRNIITSDIERKDIIRQTRGHALTLLYIAYYMAGGIPYSKEIEEKVRQDFFHYCDYAFFEKWDDEMKEVLLAVCQYPEFTVEMAEMITGNSRIPSLLEYAFAVGSFMIKKNDGVYAYRFTLQRYLRWKQSVVYTKEQLKENYERAALYYEIHDQIALALKYYEQAGNQNKVSGLLIKNAEKHPGIGHFFETREYYYKLPEETIKKSPTLMSGMSMLYSITIQPEKSEEWYNELAQFEKKAEKSSTQKREAKIRLAYLDIALPHRGIHGVIGILRNVSILCRNKKGQSFFSWDCHHVMY